jgi:NADH:ubiquinone oxidoreductase subunit E
MNDVSATTESTGYGGAACACCGQATDAELTARLDEVLAEYKGRPGALIPVLQIAQGIFGYLPEPVLKRIALSTGKSYSEVAGVVGFYSFFSTVPRGKHLVRVCLGTACYVRGGKQVLETCRQELGIDVGGTTSDGQFTLEVARCFGACGLAPTIMIDKDVHQRVKPQRLRAIFVQYRNGSAVSEPAEAKTTPKKKPGAKSKPKALPKKSQKAKPVPKRAGGKKERVVAR